MTPPRRQGKPTVNLPVGETLSVAERLIVAPSTGVFYRPDGHAAMHPGDVVNRGDSIGSVRSLGKSTPVRSPFEGLLVAILASEGERLRPGQPVAWLRVR